MARTYDNLNVSVLGMTESGNVASNLSAVVRRRMAISRWRIMVWIQRMSLAHRAEGLRWKRPGRWLCNLQAADVASLWGHLGNAARTLRGAQGPALMR